MKLKGIILLLMVLVAAGFRNMRTADLQYPSYFPDPAYNFEQNPLSPAKAELGRMLFFDPVLSKNNTISCASCHSPYNAFAHTDHDLSHGINDQIGTRNAPALFNLAWQSSFMWDGAINHLDMQALAPISNDKEMGETILHVTQKLNQIPAYRKMCYNAFNDSLITGERILKALAQFQLTLVSSGSKYDEIKKGNESFSLQEANGYKLFKQNCNSCHTEPLFSNYSFANNGLPQDSTLRDQGRYAVSQSDADSFLFKIPSLRNLSYTYPYMHDGRFKKLNEVLNHYTSDIHVSSTLSEELKIPIRLTSDEKTDLIAFLLTLNDKSFVFNPSHQFPKELLLTSKETQ